MSSTDKDRIIEAARVAIEASAKIETAAFAELERRLASVAMQPDAAYVPAFQDIIANFRKVAEARLANRREMESKLLANFDSYNFVTTQQMHLNETASSTMAALQLSVALRCLETNFHRTQQMAKSVRDEMQVLSKYQHEVAAVVNHNKLMEQDSKRYLGMVAREQFPSLIDTLKKLSATSVPMTERLKQIFIAIVVTGAVSVAALGLGWKIYQLLTN